MNTAIKSIWVKNNKVDSAPLQYTSPEGSDLDYESTNMEDSFIIINEKYSDNSKRTIAVLMGYSIIRIDYKD